MKIQSIILIACTILMLTGCSAHSPMIATNVTDVKKTSDMAYQAHQQQVFVSTALLPSDDSYELIGEVDVGKAWYGSARVVHEALAESAREMGGDAVFEVRTWFQPSGWAWAAPHGFGKVVKLKDRDGFDYSSLTGEWM